MTLENAIAIVSAHQLWRRGLPPCDRREPELPSYTPAELGVALDLVLAAARLHSQVRPAAT